MYSDVDRLRWYCHVNGYLRVCPFQETLPDALYSGLVGALSSAGLNAPGYAADALQRGSTAARARVEREAADRRQFEEYKVVLGENAPKTFAEFQNLKYNSGEWEAFKSYKRAIQIGELSALADFPLYEETSRKIDEKLIGLTTPNGITVTEKSYHFISRVIGSIEQRRSGVDVQAAARALTDPKAIVCPVKIHKDGSISQKFKYSGVEVTINPHTGNLIQTNPMSEKGGKGYD